MAEQTKRFVNNPGFTGALLPADMRAQYGDEFVPPPPVRVERWEVVSPIGAKLAGCVTLPKAMSVVRAIFDYHKIRPNIAGGYDVLDENETRVASINFKGES